MGSALLKLLKSFGMAIVVTVLAVITGLITLAAAGWKVALLIFAFLMLVALCLLVVAVRRVWREGRRAYSETVDEPHPGHFSPEHPLPRVDLDDLRRPKS